MGKIKILMVMGSTNMGGTQMFVLNLLKNMDLDRYQVDFAINFKERDGGIGQELQGMGCHIYTLPYFKIYNYYSFKKKWKKFLRLHQYEIVHGHSTNSAAVYLKIAKSMGCVTIAHCHSTGYRGNLIQRLLKGCFAKQIRYVADYWFACSSIAAEHLYGKDYQRYKYYYDIPNAICAEIYLFRKDIRRRIRKEIGVEDDVYLCGHVGSLTAPKNHAFLLEIFKEIMNMKPNARLICCGEGPLMSQVKEKAKTLGVLDKIIFPGVVKNCNEYLMAMDVFIFPSIFEGFGIAILEAEATGLPVVMSNVISDEVALTNCVHRLSLSESPKEWARIACNVFSDQREQYNMMICKSKYNMHTSAKIVMSLYDEMINSSKNYGI